LSFSQFTDIRRREDVLFPWQLLVNLIRLTLCEKWFPELNGRWPRGSCVSLDQFLNVPVSKCFANLPQTLLLRYLFFLYFLFSSYKFLIFSSGTSHIDRLAGYVSAALASSESHWTHDRTLLFHELLS
jgi:hypothetical protein